MNSAEMPGNDAKLSHREESVAEDADVDLDEETEERPAVDRAQMYEKLRELVSHAPGTDAGLDAGAAKLEILRERLGLNPEQGSENPAA